jgi:hypothetical protein
MDGYVWLLLLAFLPAPFVALAKALRNRRTS